VLSINDKLIHTILGALRLQPNIELAILFGSLASGNQRAESDLDLALDAGRVLTAAERIALVGELAGRIGRPVDLIDLRTVGEPLLGQILKHGIRILGRSAAYAALIRRHVFDSTDFLRYRDRILRERRLAWIGK